MKANGSLVTIRALDQSLDGAYLTCRVESLEGTHIAQDSIMIRVRQRTRTDTGEIDPDINVKVTPETLNATIGEFIRLQCSLIPSVYSLPIADRFKVASLFLFLFFEPISNS